jgi:RNA polymerase sigma-70 factor (sigma-E family)
MIDVSVDAGERAQFELFVGAHGDQLLYTAYGLCGDWQHAEDLVQQALIAVAQHWPRIGENRLGYAYRCLTRANVDRWRRTRRRSEVSVSAETIEFLQPSRQDTATPANSVDERLTVARALQRLAPRQRAIVVLRYLQDLPEAEVARILRISVGSVKSGAARALARLREMDVFEETR